MQEPVEEFLEGQSIVDGLAAAQIEGLEDAGQAQLFENGDEVSERAADHVLSAIDGATWARVPLGSGQSFRTTWAHRSGATA